MLVAVTSIRQTHGEYTVLCHRLSIAVSYWIVKMKDSNVRTKATSILVWTMINVVIVHLHKSGDVANENA